MVDLLPRLAGSGIARLTARLIPANGRLQDFEEACKWAEKTREDTGSRPPYLVAQTYLVLAMSQFRLKHAPEARATLAEGIEVINSQLPRFDSPSVGENSWGDWIITQALLREAKALTEGAPDTTTQTK